jgi:hypothetical protein
MLGSGYDFTVAGARVWNTVVLLLTFFAVRDGGSPLWVLAAFLLLAEPSVTRSPE